MAKSEYVVGLCLALSLLLAAVLPLPATLSQNAAPRAMAGDSTGPDCNISGEWAGKISAKEYVVFELKQDNGQITGRYMIWPGPWRDISFGSMNKTSFMLKTADNRAFKGTVSDCRQVISGTWYWLTKTGYHTWAAGATNGGAQCTNGPDPQEHSGQVKTVWGSQVNYQDLEGLGGAQAAQPAARRRVAMITNPGSTKLAIDLTLIGPNLPATVRVVKQVGSGNKIVLGTLRRVSQQGNRARYRGPVEIKPVGLRPGRMQIIKVSFENPWRNNRWVLIAIITAFLRDPAGNIYDTVTSEMIPDATCFLYKKEGSEWQLWPAAEFGQVNPMPSDPVGHYAWLTDFGDFKVKAVKEGFTDGWGGPVTVPPDVTDLHIGLTPTNLPAPGMGDVWLSDYRGYPADEFDPNQEIQAHVPVSNTTSADMATTARWTTTDPFGQVVPGLSTTTTYGIGPFAADLSIHRQVPRWAMPGLYTFGIEIEYEGQTQYSSTQFWVAGEYAVHLPMVLQSNQTSLSPETEN